MRFIKENSYDIVKFFIYQIGLAVFSLTLAIPLEAAVEGEKNDAIVQLGVSILAIAFYFILVYTVSWDHGATDRIKIEGGKTTYDGLKGAKIALLANIPNFLVSALATVASLLFADGNAWTGVLGVSLMILGLIESMYLGTAEMIASALPNPSTAFYLVKSLCFMLLPLIVVIAAHLGYVLGDKNVKIFGFLGNKSKK